MALPAELETSLRAYAASRHISSGIQARWLGWAPADAAALLDLAVALGLGGNHIADLLTCLEDISARDRSSPAAVLAAPEIHAVLHARIGRGDKLKGLKALLRGRRYPRLTALEKALDAEVRALGLGGAVTVRFPPGLEGDEVTVELRARTSARLREVVDRLGVAVAAGGFDRMFELLDEAS